MRTHPRLPDTTKALQWTNLTATLSTNPKSPAAHKQQSQSSTTSSNASPTTPHKPTAKPPSNTSPNTTPQHPPTKASPTYKKPKTRPTTPTQQPYTPDASPTPHQPKPPTKPPQKNTYSPPHSSSPHNTPPPKKSNQKHTTTAHTGPPPRFGLLGKSPAVRVVMVACVGRCVCWVLGVFCLLLRLLFVCVGGGCWGGWVVYWSASRSYWMWNPQRLTSSAVASRHLSLGVWLCRSRSRISVIDVRNWLLVGKIGS